VHVGDPAALGIRDLQRPDFGDAVPVTPGEMAVFWACGVTPQAVMMQAKPVLALTHAPGHMFISDRRDSTLAVLYDPISHPYKVLAQLRQQRHSACPK
jgi:uncharacterized protein YcsI (UPF0317 family)